MSACQGDYGNVHCNFLRYYHRRLHERVVESLIVTQADHQLRQLWPLEHEHVLQRKCVGKGGGEGRERERERERWSGISRIQWRLEKASNLPMT